jgi:hypothetical protein
MKDAPRDEPNRQKRPRFRAIAAEIAKLMPDIAPEIHLFSN